MLTNKSYISETEEDGTVVGKASVGSGGHYQARYLRQYANTFERAVLQAAFCRLVVIVSFH